MVITFSAFASGTTKAVTKTTSQLADFALIAQPSFMAAISSYLGSSANPAEMELLVRDPVPTRV